MLRGLGSEAVSAVQASISCFVRLCAIKTAALIGTTRALGESASIDTAVIEAMIKTHCADMFVRSLRCTVWDAPWDQVPSTTEQEAAAAILRVVAGLFDDKLSQLEPAIMDMLSGVHDDCNRLAYVSRTMSTFAADKRTVHDGSVQLVEIYSDMVNALSEPTSALVQRKRLEGLTHRYRLLRADGISPDDAHRATVVESIARRGIA